MIHRLLALLISAIVTMTAFAGESDTSTRALHPAFRTLQVGVADAPFAPPIVELGVEGHCIEISFDELSTDRRYLRYRLEHLDAVWRPDGLVDSEFVDGFNEGTIDDVDFSQATLVHYVSYRLTLPNDEVKFTISGNYLVKIYDEEAPDETLVQARFSVSEATTPIAASVSVVTDIDSRAEHQQLALSVDTRNIVSLRDPFNDLRVVVTQNNSPLSEVVLTTPQRVTGHTAVYEHLRSLIFTAGNEYRRFETVSTTFPGIGIETIAIENPVVNAYLHPSYPRAREHYTYDSTQQGAFTIRAADVADARINADYVMTHFSLCTPRLSDADIYIEGDLTSRLLDSKARMTWDDERECYTLSMLLKQGSYNYRYVKARRDGKVDNSIDGDKYQTVNTYTVRVYHRPPGSRYDRLVGTTHISSAQ